MRAVYIKSGVQDMLRLPLLALRAFAFSHGVGKALTIYKFGVIIYKKGISSGVSPAYIYYSLIHKGEKICHFAEIAVTK